MHRIDTPTATPDSKFTEGNPTAGVEATVVTDDWLNSVQEELCNLLTSNGVTLDKENNTQLQVLVAALLATKAAKNGSSANQFYAKAPTLDGHAVNLEFFKQRALRVEQNYGAYDHDLTSSFESICTLTDGDTTRGITDFSPDYLIEFSALVYLGAAGSGYEFQYDINGTSECSHIFDTGSNEEYAWKPICIRFHKNDIDSMTINAQLRCKGGSAKVKNAVLTCSAVFDEFADGAS